MSDPGDIEAERAVARALMSAWPVLDQAAAEQIAHSLASTRDADAIVSSLPWVQWVQHIADAVAPIAAAAEAAVRSETARLGGARITGAFDHIDVVAVRYAEQESARLIHGLSDAQRQSIRAVVAQALGGRFTVAQAGAAIRDSIGLHDRWAEAVSNRRDKVYWSGVQRGMSDARANALADRMALVYRNRLIRVRATAIARTEIATAASAGRFASWVQMIGSGNASMLSQKEWSAAGGACPTCTALNGTRVPWDQPFDGGRMMPPAHPNCRCTAVLVQPDGGGPGIAPQPVDWLSVTQPAQALFANAQTDGIDALPAPQE